MNKAKRVTWRELAGSPLSRDIFSAHAKDDESSLTWADDRLAVAVRHWNWGEYSDAYNEYMNELEYSAIQDPEMQKLINQELEEKRRLRSKGKKNGR